MSKEQRFDIHQHITNQIVAAIEAGAGEFRLPWHRSAGNIMRPVNVASKKSLSRRQCAGALGDRRGEGLLVRHMGHLSPMGRDRRAGEEGREGGFHRLLQGA